LSTQVKTNQQQLSPWLGDQRTQEFKNSRSGNPAVALFAGNPAVALFANVLLDVRRRIALESVATASSGDFSSS